MGRWARVGVGEAMYGLGKRRTKQRSAQEGHPMCACLNISARAQRDMRNAVTFIKVGDSPVSRAGASLAFQTMDMSPAVGAAMVVWAREPG